MVIWLFSLDVFFHRIILFRENTCKYYYSMQASLLGDSLRTEQNNIAKLQRQFDKQKQEQDLRNAQESREKLLQWSILGGVAALLVVLVLLVNRQRLQRKASQTLAAQNEEIRQQQALLAERTVVLEQEQQRTNALLQETEVLRQRSEQEKAYLSSAVETILEAMTTLAEGNLRVEIEVSSNDDIGRLAEGINKTVRNMREAIAQVSETSCSVNQSASAIAEVANNLLQLAQVQQLQMSIINNSVEETTAAINHGAQHVEIAKSSVADEQRIALQASSVVEQLIERFSTVNSLMENFASMIHTLTISSEKVGDFVGEIKDVADKTNLLALNAAIEAARAGDYGRGFAVVAQEVQDLAEHSHQTTKKIAQVIRAIQNNIAKTSEAMRTTIAAVEQGLTDADNTAQALKAIVRGSQNSADAMNNVSAASEQQISAGKNITQHIADLKSAARHTVTGIQSIADVTNNLHQFSSQLEQQMKKFHF
jgi:methyl-accepting chemotaxis protein